MRPVLFSVIAAALLSAGVVGTATAAPGGMPSACAEFAALVQKPQAAFQMEWTEGGKKRSGWKCAVTDPEKPTVCMVDEFGNTAKVRAVWVSRKHTLEFYKGTGARSRFVKSFGPTGKVTKLAKPVTADGYCVIREMNRS